MYSYCVLYMNKRKNISNVTIIITIKPIVVVSIVSATWLCHGASYKQYYRYQYYLFLGFSHNNNNNIIIICLYIMVFPRWRCAGRGMMSPRDREWLHMLDFPVQRWIAVLMHTKRRRTPRRLLRRRGRSWWWDTSSSWTQLRACGFAVAVLEFVGI